jgi:iron complex outermembrane receptor protein
VTFSRRSILRGLATAVLAGTVAHPLQAQRDTTTARDSAARDSAARHTLAPVRVTVLRTPFDITRAPLDVAAAGPRDIAVARPGFSLDEALGNIGGVQVDDRYNFALGERISVRGLGARSQFGVRGVRVIVDGIPATLPDGQTSLNNVDLGSIGGAEVIRGPAAALYGNASGGVISLRSAPAPAQPFAPSVRLMRGSDGLARVQGAIGGTQGRGTYTLNADRLDYGGYRAFSDARNAHVNGIATWDWDRVSLRVVGNGMQYTAHNPGALTDSAVRADRRAALPNNVVQQTGNRGKQNQFGTSVRAHLGPGELQLSGYALRRAINNPIAPTIIGIHRAVGGGRAAYALTAGDAQRSVTTIVGGESDMQRDDRRNWVNVKGAPGALTLDQRERVSNVSPFAQVTATAGALSLLGGVRYDSYRFAARDHFITSTNPDDSGVRRMYATSPSLGLTYEVWPLLTLYGNVATGFQTPTTTELANRPTGAGGFNPTLQPERTHSREIGARGETGIVNYTVALYDMRVDDELIPFEVPSTPGRQFYRNAGTARHRGGEADLTVALTPDVRVRGSYTLTNARYVTYSVTSGGKTSAYAGKRVPGIAPQSGALSLQLGEPASRFVAIEERLQSFTPVNDANTARSAGYATTNLRGELRRGAMSVFGGIGNLFDAKYNASVTINAALGRYYEPAPGRTVYLGVGAR